MLLGEVNEIPCIPGVDGDRFLHQHMGSGSCPQTASSRVCSSVCPWRTTCPVASWPRLARGGLLRPAAVERVWNRWRDVLSIVARRGARQDVATLSGGNQQKTVLGRWLERDCAVLVLVEPTRGVDVGARAEIYRVLESLAQRGIAVIAVSSDIEEVIRLADTVHVMLQGHLVATYTRPDIDRATLISAASADAPVGAAASA